MLWLVALVVVASSQSTVVYQAFLDAQSSVDSWAVNGTINEWQNGYRSDWYTFYHPPTSFYLDAGTLFVPQKTIQVSIYPMIVTYPNIDVLPYKQAVDSLCMTLSFDVRTQSTAFNLQRYFGVMVHTFIGVVPGAYNGTLDGIELTYSTGVDPANVTTYPSTHTYPRFSARRPSVEFTCTDPECYTPYYDTCDYNCIIKFNTSVPHVPHVPSVANASLFESPWVHIVYDIQPLNVNQSRIRFNSSYTADNTPIYSNYFDVNTAYKNSLQNLGFGLGSGDGNAYFKNIRISTTCFTFSLEPSPSPSLEPSPKPSFEPSPSPSLEPTPKPSFEPSSNPSFEPTPKPSFEPSPSPSFEPTIVVMDTIEPTPNPMNDGVTPTAATVNSIQQPSNTSQNVFITTTLIVVSFIAFVFCLLYARSRFSAAAATTSTSEIGTRHQPNDVELASSQYNRFSLKHLTGNSYDDTNSAKRHILDTSRAASAASEHIYLHMKLNPTEQFTVVDIDSEDCESSEEMILDVPLHYGDTTLSTQDTTTTKTIQHRRPKSNYDNVSDPLNM